MRLLLDTHVLFWAIMDRTSLSVSALTALNDDDNDVVVSVASAWEIAIKVGLKKWPEAHDLIIEFEACLDRSGFELLPVTVQHVRHAGLMQSPHRDPFDRLLAAQAVIEGLTIVAVDPKLIRLGAPVLW